METNNFILIRYNEFEQNPTVEGYFASVQDAKEHARLTFPEDAISIYELVADAKDLAEKTKEQKMITHIVPAKQYVMDAIKYLQNGDDYGYTLGALQRALFSLNLAIDAYEEE